MKPRSMAELRSFIEAVGAADIRAAVWQEALARHAGNIAHAAAEFGFTKQRGHALTRRHGLVELARELRLSAGQASTGRPKSNPTPLPQSKKGQ